MSMELQPLNRRDSLPSLTLSTLPSDIIRLIIPMVGEPVERMRLIAPSWNAMILDHLSIRSNHPHLDAIHIHTGGPELAKDIKVSTALLSTVQTRHFRQMSKWTTSQARDRLESPTLRLRILTEDSGSLAIFAAYVVVALLSVGWRIHWIASVVLFVALMIYAGYLRFYYGPLSRDNCAYLTSIFIRCSSIKELHLHKINRETLKIVRKTLGDVPVEHLIIYDKECNDGLRKIIIEMARLHKVETLILCDKRFEEKGLRKFFLAVTETAKDVQIYETSNETEKIFGKSKQFWEKKAQEICDDSLSMQVMNGESLLGGEGTNLLRLRVGQ